MAGLGPPNIDCSKPKRCGINWNLCKWRPQPTPRAAFSAPLVLNRISSLGSCDPSSLLLLSSSCLMQARQGYINHTMAPHWPASHILISFVKLRRQAPSSCTLSSSAKGDSSRSPFTGRLFQVACSSVDGMTQVRHREKREKKRLTVTRLSKA